MTTMQDAPKILWGAKAIGQVIGRSPRQTYHLLETGALPATKVGTIWVATQDRLMEVIAGGEAA